MNRSTRKLVSIRKQLILLKLKRLLINFQHLTFKLNVRNNFSGMATLIIHRYGADSILEGISALKYV